MATVAINRGKSNALLFGVLIVGWLIAGAAVETAFWSDLARKPSPMAWATLLIGAGFFCAVLGYLVTYATARLATAARFGDDLQFSTWLIERRLDWADVGRIVFKEMSTPLPAKFTIKFVATDGTRFDVYASGRQSEELLALVETKNLAANWPGLPLYAGTVWAIFALGCVAVAVGLGIDMMLWQELQRAPAPLNAGKAIILAIGIPLIGLTSVSFATFHLLRRPIVIRAGVFRIREAEAMTIKALFNRLFGQFD